MSEEYSLHDSLGYMISVAARIQERRIENLLKQFGLTISGWCVLLAVGVEGMSHPSDIASFIRVDRTAASRALRQLEQDGLIARTTGKPDRRTTNVVLTARGEQILKEAIPAARANNDVMSALLDDGEEAQLRASLRKLIDRDPLPLNSF